jgi:hypothetical protein
LIGLSGMVFPKLIALAVHACGLGHGTSAFDEEDDRILAQAILKPSA